MSESLRYIDWNYDTQEAIEYERVGECNGCGACCMAIIEFNVSNYDDGQQGGKSVVAGEGGIWTEISRGNVRRFFKFKPVDTSRYSRCDMLNYDNKCRLHAYGAKKLIQSGWPFSPQNIIPFPTCSYSFREINRWVIGS